MLTDGQLAFRGQQSCRQDSFGLQQRQKEGDGVFVQLPDHLDGLACVPQQILKAGHGCKIAA